MNTESSSPTEAPKSKADCWVKFGFALVAIGIVGWLIGRQYIGTPLPGWDTDLPDALELAAQTDRQVVAIIYDSPQNHNYKRLRGVVSKPGNREAMDKANLIRVHTKLSKKDPLARKYRVGAFPTTVLIGSDGEMIVQWTGYIGEVDYREKLLQGKPRR